MVQIKVGDLRGWRELNVLKERVSRRISAMLSTKPCLEEEEDSAISTVASVVLIVKFVVVKILL